MKYFATIWAFLLLNHFAYSQQVSFFEQIPKSSLNSAQIQDFNRVSQHERFSISQVVRLNPLSLGINSDNNLLVSLPLEFIQPEDCQRLAFKPKTSRFIDDQNYYYYGQLERGDTTYCSCNSGEIMLESVNGRKYGYIRADEVQYEIISIDENYSMLGKVNLNYFNRFEECFNIENTPPPPPPEEEVKSRDGFSCEIKVLFLYTQASLNANSLPTLNEITNLAISQTNQALYNSQVNDVRVVKVGNLLLPGFAQTPFSIDADMSAFLASPLAASLRTAYSADAICLIVNMPYILLDGRTVLGAAGFRPNQDGTFTTNEGAPQSNLAYMIVEDNAISANFTFSHEFGHVLGCRHQTCALFPTGGCSIAGTIEHGHGWGERKAFLCSWKNYSSILHQLREGNQRLLNYSNPAVAHNGYPTGIAGVSNNASWINNTGGCIVSGYFNDPVQTLAVKITGEDLLCKPNTGQYTILPTILGNYTFEWHKSSNAVNWGQPIGTGQTLTLSSANYAIGQTIFLRATLFDAQGTPYFAFFEVLIGDPNDVNCPRSAEISSSNETDISVFPNPSDGNFNITYRVKNDGAPVGIQLFTIDGKLLHEVKWIAPVGEHTMQITPDKVADGPILLQLKIGEKQYHKLIIKQ